MKDRFRFRVWNKKNKEMIYNAEIAYDGMNYNTSWQLGKNTNDGWVDCFGYYLDYPEDYEVMQCTGLKDKNGKLIYEGDVVRFAQYEIEDIEPDWEYTEVIWGGEDKYPAFDLKYQCFDSNGLSWIFNENYIIEVIGNIYVDKDLLNENS